MTKQELQIDLAPITGAQTINLMYPANNAYISAILQTAMH